MASLSLGHIYFFCIFSRVKHSTYIYFIFFIFTFDEINSHVYLTILSNKADVNFPINLPIIKETFLVFSLHSKEYHTISPYITPYYRDSVFIPWRALLRAKIIHLQCWTQFTLRASIKWLSDLYIYYNQNWSKRLWRHLEQSLQKICDCKATASW